MEIQIFLNDLITCKKRLDNFYCSRKTIPIIFTCICIQYRYSSLDNKNNISITLSNPRFNTPREKVSQII